MFIEDLGLGEGRPVEDRLEEIMDSRGRVNVEIAREWKKKKEKKLGKVRPWVAITEARELEERMVEKARQKEERRERRWERGRQMVKIGKRVWKLVK